MSHSATGADLGELHLRIWQALTRATADRHHPWRTPVLATVDAAGLPNARTVVLRRAVASEKLLEFFTDARSRKVLELRHQATASLVFWHPGHRWQLRVQTEAEVLTDGDLVDAAWARVKSSAAAADYLSALPPGSVLASGNASDSASAQAVTSVVSQHLVAPAQHHFALLRMRVTALDWLHLSRDGHQRAVWMGDGSGEWVQA